MVPASFSDDSRVIKDDVNRPKWDNKLQYLLSCIGFAVGFGNVWRFPYLCQTYGGGAFLIPYVIALVFEGIPIFHLELAIGQCLRKGSIGVWTQISPYLGGLGYACMMVSFLVSVYYNMILAWVTWYFVNSFRNPLPWSSCPQDASKPELIEECHKSTATNFFWYRHTLHISADITQSGPLLWWLVLCLAICWIVVYICTIRGIESTGKAIYVTTTFPYLILTAFLIYGLTLPGAVDGLVYLFTPNVGILSNPRAWLDAATQIFYSLSLAFGGHIAYSSYIPQKNDCEKDAVVIATVNSLTSMYASIPIFSILGFKATMSYWDCLDRNIKNLINAFNITQSSISRSNYTRWLDSLTASFPNKIQGLNLKTCDLEHFLDQSASGAGLAFIVFTEAVVRMPGAQAWAVLFFIMLFNLGLSSMFGLVQGVLTPLTEFPIVSKYLTKEAVCGIICLLSFLLGLCFTLRSGSYWLEVFDGYVGTMPLLVIAFFEVMGVIFIYGMKRFCDDVRWMTGRPVKFYWKASWQIISPVLMGAVFLAYIAIQRPPSYSAWNPDYEHFPVKEQKGYPGWIVFICALLTITPCAIIPIAAIHHFGQVMWARKQKQAQRPSNNPTST
ncbi:sodium-dependent neutral amino acid transporter B(0)AT3-like [Sceloporus undulatus]|uniref:sodium-dependent neutral amino acid transporter B(0)AT3-like n=1 Tax=Sceloporus undulatus TaxID=8520 RepID=UPI001C4B9180|nr:sodium-dependent neutral amino acid transporter B(0)AT3-like [Sceloporus undulatus]